jgi:hypothetical protein
MVDQQATAPAAEDRRMTPAEQVRYAARLIQRMLAGDYGTGRTTQIPAGAKRLSALYSGLVGSVERGDKATAVLMRARDLRVRAERYRDVIPRGEQLPATLDELEESINAWRLARGEAVPPLPARRRADVRALVPVEAAPAETAAAPFDLESAQAERVLDLLDRAWIAEARAEFGQGGDRVVALFLRYTNPENQATRAARDPSTVGWSEIDRDGRESRPYRPLEGILATSEAVDLAVLRVAALDGFYPERRRDRCYVCHKARTDKRPLYEIGGVYVCAEHFRALALKAIRQSRQVFFSLRADYQRAETATRIDRQAARVLAPDPD